MNRRCLLLSLVAFLTVIYCLPTPTSAVPVFARKYGFQCSMCHSAFPRLNDFGVRYRQNGYQLPGRENEERTVLDGPAPFAARTNGGYNYRKFENVDQSDVRQFQLNSLDLLSAGLIARDIGYFVVYPPEISESRGVVGQSGTLEMASVVFTNLATGWVNVRAGRMEPAYVAFSAKRNLSFSPYEVYDAAFPGGPAFSDTQTGVEIYGQGRWPGLSFGYAAGLLNGSETNLSNDGPADAYARAYVVIGQGEGQTAGQRIGVVGYVGKSRPEGFPEIDRQRFTRYGLDASLNYGTWNLALQYLRGKDDKALWDAAEDADTSGGFGELSWQPLTKFVAFGRYDLVRAPDFVDADLSRFTLGARYYFADQLALHGEWSKRTLDFSASEALDEKETFYTLSLDLAF